MRFKDVKAVIEFLKSQIPIKTLIEKDTNTELQRSGKNWVCLCPFHPESAPSFRVSDPSSPTQRFRCYGASCEKKGDIITWTCLRHGMDTAEAIVYLAKEFSINIDPFMVQEDPKIARYMQIMNIFIDFTSNINRETAVLMMEERGISAEATEKFKVGWSPSLKEAVDHLRGNGVSFEEIRILELDNEFLVDQTLVIPHMDMYGRIVGMKCRRSDASGDAKYYGVSKSHPLYPDKLLFGLCFAKKSIYEFGGTMIEVEGDIDVIHMHDEGYTNTVGVGGSLTELTEAQARQLNSLMVDEIIKFPDGDQPGIDSILKAAKKYKKTYGNKLLRIATVDKQYGKDPDLILKNGHINKISEAIANATHPIQFFIDYIKSGYDLNNITGAYQFINTVSNSFEDLSMIDFDMLAKYCAQVTELDVKHVQDYIKQQTVDINLYEYSAEESFLASVFTSNKDWIMAMTDLSADDFSVFNRDLAEKVFEFYQDNKGKDISQERFIYWLSINNFTHLVDKLSILHRHMTDMSLIVDLIKDRSHRRKIRQSCEATRIKVYDLTTPAIEIVTQFKIDVSNKSINLLDDAEPDIAAGNYINELKTRMESDSMIIGLPLSSRWRKLNRLWSGVQLGEQVLLTAPTGSGKSCIATEWGTFWAVDPMGPKEPVLYINGEMKKFDVITRIISIMTGIGNTKIRVGDLTPEEAKIVANAVAIYQKGSLYIETPRFNTFSEWMNLIEYHRDKHGCKYVICDYIQLLRPEAGSQRWQELGDASISLHARAIRPGDELGLIIVAQENEDGRNDRFGGVNYTAGAKQIGRDADKCLSSRKLTREQIQQNGLNNGNMTFYVSKDRAGEDDIIIPGFLSKHRRGSLRIGEVESMGDDQYWPISELQLGGDNDR